MDTINKSKIIYNLKEKTGLSGTVCEEILNSFFIQIKNVVCTHKLTLKNFGNFKVVTKPSRPARNFQTKQAVTLAPRKVLRFTPARSLKISINTQHEKILLD